jgi:hypothetical protein
MDYTSYFTPAPHTFGYLGFSNDANVPTSHDVSSESNVPIQVRDDQPNLQQWGVKPTQNHGLIQGFQSMELENNFEASLRNLMPAVYEYNFDGPMRSNDNGGTKDNNAPAMRHDSSSSTSSSPAQNLSSILLSSGGNDPMDSGMVLDLDGETALLAQEDRRSNSMDKELLTPAQSRRKAQNRAA